MPIPHRRLTDAQTLVTGVGHVQVDHLHPPSTDSLTGQGHVTVCINSRTTSRLKPIVARWRIGLVAENLSTRHALLEDLHLVQFATLKKLKSYAIV